MIISILQVTTQYQSLFQIKPLSLFLSFSIGGKALKTLSKYGLDISFNEEDKEVCFGLSNVESMGVTGNAFFTFDLVVEDTPMGIVVRHLPFMDIPPMMLPLKKMKYMDVDVFVPNNPIIFLEKIFEQGNDVWLFGRNGDDELGIAGSECI